MLDMEEGGSLKVYATSWGLFPMLTSREPPFEESLNYLKFVYITDRAGDYVAPKSTVFAQSAIAEQDELFPEILKHLRRLYPEVYGPAVSLGWAPAFRHFHLGYYGAGLSGGNLLNNRFSELGACAGRFNHISSSTSRINNPLSI